MTFDFHYYFRLCSRLRRVWGSPAAPMGCLLVMVDGKGKVLP